MNDMITLRGWVGTEPTMGLTKHNTPYSRFRMSVNERRFDRERQSWVDGHTSWYNVACYGHIADNVAESVHKGQRIIVLGRLQIRSFQRTDGTFGTEADLVATSLGHDLALGIARWNRRRDEADRGPSLRSTTQVEGIGAVDPATGEIAGNPGPDELFGPEPEDFGEDHEFLGPNGTGAAYEGAEPPAQSDRAGEVMGPEGRLLSA
ncbi:single-stranded DNA-binding protein [Sinomonas sp. ASV486]|uniref:Single-stranded DNA-binding protein n=1 Tax=Sinomonas puerhi TaxID=3238584 RepID=A0AB39KZ02_9MICC|nr:single-stranded DNA-binding protein [Sinomonas sp. ASV486]MDQ4492368.1 single-stranded DNA-binding protein [Sinomonas sp. ASV486]